MPIPRMILALHDHIVSFKMANEISWNDGTFQYYSSALKWCRLFNTYFIQGIYEHFTWISPSGQDIFCLKNLTLSQEHPRSWVENECCCLPRNGTDCLIHVYIKGIYVHITWISPSGQDIFCLKNFTLSQEHLFVGWKWMLLPAPKWYRLFDTCLY